MLTDLTAHADSQQQIRIYFFFKIVMPACDARLQCSVARYKLYIFFGIFRYLKKRRMHLFPSKVKMRNT